MSGIGDEDVIDPSDISASYGNKFGTGLDNTVKDKRNREINKYVVDDNDDDNDSDNDNMSSSQQARGGNYSGADGLRSDRILFGSDENNDKGSNKNGNRNKRPMSLSPDREDMFTSSKVLSSSSVSGREYKDVIREAMENKEKANAEKDNINGDQQGASAIAAPPSKRSRWDMQPKGQSAASKPSDTEATPLIISQNMKTPLTFDHGMAKTPMHLGFIGSENKSDDGVSIESDNARVSADLMKRMKIDREIAILNRPLSDAELDEILPKEGYVIITPPDNYVPIRTPARISLSTPAPMDNKSIFSMSSSETPSRDLLGDGSSIATSQTYQSMLGSTVSAGDLPYIPPEDMQFFGKLMTPASEDATKEEIKERLIMELLLKIKNGNPSQRKSAMRIITEKARDFGAQALFSQILPIMMSPTIEDQDRHQMVKVIDRVLFKLDDMIRPFVHKILAVIQPMLSSEDYYVRIEAREILSNVAKAAGLATMIATMRPDIDSPDDFVRKTTAQAFAVVANSLGVPTVLPFIKAVCQSRKSWQARHTGVKIIQQISILLGCAILPFLGQLVVIIKDGLTDEENKVRVMTSLAVASLAEAANPYGFECFGPVLKPLLDGARSHRGKSLTAYLKAMGCIISLMDQDYASRYTRDIMPILIREFKSPDEETKSIVLRVVKQCVSTGGIDPQFVREQIVPEYFRCFWVRRIALERRNYAQLIDTTVEIGKKVGCGEILSKLVIDLRDESEPYRRMVMETIDKLVQKLGLSDVDGRLEEQLIDGVVFAFVEQTQSDQVPIIGKIQNDRALGAAGSGIMLNGFSTVMNALGKRAKPYLPQITASALYRLHNKSSDVRMQAVDLISRLAPILKMCDEEGLLARCGHVLFENLGEEYPEVLGSILGALRSIVSVIGIDNMKPPIHDLLPRLTPILKNRHEKVQENAIDLVGRIADRGAEYVSAREWIRICFELLEMLKAGRKSIRRAAVSTFGFVAKAIGPSDVLHTLLNNLKVQERQLRVCTTVAIAIVAETCEPFTVLPALMNEYRVPDTNIQNGVLKALSFLFEYIGPVAKDYIYSIVPLLQDALIDRDMVHRQIACTCVKHIALGVQGQGCEDALMHLLNFVWPNIFETSPHVIHAVLESIEALRVSLGSHIIFLYVLQGLFHPAKRIRETYWRIYNNLYVYSVESLIPVFPRLEDDSGDLFLDNTHLRKKKKVEESGGLPNSFPASYQREYLDMFL